MMALVSHFSDRENKKDQGLESSTEDKEGSVLNFNPGGYCTADAP